MLIYRRATKTTQSDTGEQQESDGTTVHEKMADVMITMSSKSAARKKATKETEEKVGMGRGTIGPTQP